MNNINKNSNTKVSYTADLRPAYSAADAAQLTHAVQKAIANLKSLLFKA